MPVKERSAMTKIVKFMALGAILIVFAAAATEAAEWSYHFAGWDTCQYVDVKVWGTINCVEVSPPLFEGTVQKCNTIKGWLPFWCNDYIIEVDWRPYCHCNNHDFHKHYVGFHNGSVWEVRPMFYYLEYFCEIMPDKPPVPMPDVYQLLEPNGQVIHVSVNLAQWMIAATPAQTTYSFTGGTCPDLPGYFVGTTPSVYNPSEPPSGYPMRSETPYSGTLIHAGEVHYEPLPGSPSITGYGLIVLAALILITGVWVYRKKRSVVPV